MHLRLWTDLLGLAGGVIEALLLVRLVAQLFAVRPDQDVLQYILLITAPLVQLFSFFDRGQPLFGARLEFSTLTLALLLPIGVYILSRAGRRLKKEQ